MGKLDGKVAALTGGATGIGLAGARLFVEEGAHVFIQFDRAFSLNVRGTLFTVQKALPLIQQAWARVWLNELRDRKIRVNVRTPGQVATAKQEELFDEATMDAFESLIPRGQMGRPEEIATVALFLASDDSSYVNGMEPVADGGTTAI
jgi:NAD(P)-dependent dehydrogenase (short-subunit alcohol dehydrogenase family)